ncbi:MAG: class I SAM-dependent methyltransferase [Actinobacteria bacterium]|nr:class I SAM-dependent methyltransferase [Actinomycetota bacterium]
MVPSREDVEVVGFGIGAERVARPDGPTGARRLRTDGWRRRSLGGADRAAGEFEAGRAPNEYVAAHEGWGSTARFFASRLYLVDRVLGGCRPGRLLDVGCGPGVLVHRLLDDGPRGFDITACDRSAAMVDAVVRTTLPGEKVQAVVASIEDMPFADSEFDVVVALGVLEYANCRGALREVHRVLRPGGTAVVTMLNPLSPYRLAEWFLYWPVLRWVGHLERIVGVPEDRRHGARRSGVRAVPARRLARLLSQAGLVPQEVVFYDVNFLVPPFDKLARRWSRRWRRSPERTLGRGWRRWLGTGYLVVARRPVVEGDRRS